MARVLIVDDSQFFRKSLGKVIHENHEVVAFAEDGFEAISKYKIYQPEVVLLDITMPNKDGKECLKDLLAEDPNAKIIIISALQSESIIDEFIELGAQDFIAKDKIFQTSAEINGKITELIGG